MPFLRACGLHRRSRIQPLLATLVVANALACAGEPRSAEGSPDPGLVVPADSIHVVGTSDQIARIKDVLPGPDGVVWVLNTGDPFFIALGEDGDVVRAWGPQGQGPREFGSPDSFVRDPGAEGIWVYDRNSLKNALVRVDVPEDEWTQLALPKDSLPANRVLYPHFAGNAVSNVWLRPGAGAFLVARASADPGSGDAVRNWAADIVAVDKQGSVQPVLSIADLLGDPESKYPGGSEFMPYPIWDVCATDGSFAVYDPLQNAVRHFASDGAEREAVQLPAERMVEITVDRVVNMVLPLMLESVPSGMGLDSATLRTQLESQWPQISQQIAEVFPEYVDLRCAQDGTVWIQPFEAEAGRFGLNSNWLRIRADGSLERISLPENFYHIRFEGDRIWGYVRDDLGIQSVAWLALPGTRRE